jgi:phosphoenolpyruvate synthase/pyruvate phosphate dikinase
VISYIVREPLIHFLLIGGVIYLFFSSAEEKKSNTTVVTHPIALSKDEVLQRQKEYEQLFQTKTDIQLEEAIRSQLYHKKLLLQAAKDLQLIESDPLIQKRLLEKMRAILHKKTEIEEPTEQQLYDYYKNHIQEYSKREKISLYRVHFDKLKQKEAAKLYKFLQNIEPQVLQLQQHNFTPQQLEEKFGSYLKKQILLAQKKEWLEAIPSKDGWEFVYIDGYTTKEPYSFEDVQGRVYRDYKEDQMQSSFEQEIQKLSKRYPLVKEKQ